MKFQIGDYVELGDGPTVKEEKRGGKGTIDGVFASGIALARREGIPMPKVFAKWAFRNPDEPVYHIAWDDDQDSVDQGFVEERDISLVTMGNA